MCLARGPLSRFLWRYGPLMELLSLAGRPHNLELISCLPQIPSSVSIQDWLAGWLAFSATGDFLPQSPLRLSYFFCFFFLSTVVYVVNGFFCCSFTCRVVFFSSLFTWFLVRSIKRFLFFFSLRSPFMWLVVSSLDHLYAKWFLPQFVYVVNGFFYGPFTY